MGRQRRGTAMKHFQVARAAMVALAALGVISTTPTFAAGLDSGSLGVYSNQPQNPTQPIDPNLPGPYLPFGPPDLKVSYVSKVAQNGSMTWTYMVKNIGTGIAKDVKMEKVAVRNGFSGSNGIQTETTWETVGDMGP